MLRQLQSHVTQALRTAFRHQRLSNAPNRACSSAAPGAAAEAVYAESQQPAIVHGLSDTHRRVLATWLGGCTVYVGGMVLLGGYTRLSGSGLSMTHWNFVGEWPPMNEQQWHQQFALYQQSPEYQRVNNWMTLEDYQEIFWVEWAHRMGGRGLGVLFLAPLPVFGALGMLNRALGARLALLGCLGGAQGLIGWYMVQSGLQDSTMIDPSKPKVNPYRLSMHLMSAFGIFSIMTWTTLTLSNPISIITNAPDRVIAGTRQIRALLHPLTALIGATALAGAFVAGLDAGRAYNTWPLMDDQWVPRAYWSDQVPTWRNMFENPAAVQFHHRCLAAATSCLAFVLYMRLPGLSVHKRTARAVTVLAALVGGQFTLGIYTLLHAVPEHLGVAHQAGALALFAASIWAMHTTRKPLNLGAIKHVSMGGPVGSMPGVGVSGRAAGL